MKFWRTVLAIVLVVAGAVMVNLGERDDSPGLGGVGIFVALAGVWMLVRPLMRKR